MIRWACSDCGTPRFLLTRFRGRLICADCWRKAGSPFPRGENIDQELEGRTRAKMVQRGGTDAYRVRAGKT